ncbi:MAG: hypothetical protein K6F88_08900 [Ruminococcus sp.]|nr:hypothetical protein [Ruminococcus sp.]
MRNLIYKFQTFMQGRYGSDELNITLIVFSVIISIVSRFFMFNLPVQLILMFVSLGLLGLAVFRFLSTNIYGRTAENRKFKPVFSAVTGWFKLTYKKFRDGRTHRYYKCPQCKAQLRVKNVKGKHTIRCPKCGNKFEKTIR